MAVSFKETPAGREKRAKIQALYDEAVNVRKLTPIGENTHTGKKSAVYWVAATIGMSAAGVRHHLVDMNPDLIMAERFSPAVPADLEHLPQSEMRDHISIQDGVVIAFSDSHWTTVQQCRSVAHEALLRVCRHIHPTHILAVGDLMDLAAVSKHPRRRRDQPHHKVATEIACAQTHLADLRLEAPSAECWWIYGNHDDRLETYLAGQADALENLAGTRLQDNFQAWHFTHRLDINDDTTAIHVWHRGERAAHHNAQKTGRNYITGDTHALTTHAVTYDNKTRWGIECGMLADPQWIAFHYLNAIPVRWCPGFVVLTWRDGKLLPPETVRVCGNDAYFRNQLVISKVRVQARGVKS
jgi:hypothetical protein